MLENNNNNPDYTIIKLYDTIKNSTDQAEKNTALCTISIHEQLPSVLCSKIFFQINTCNSAFSEETKLFVLKQVHNLIKLNIGSNFKRKELIDIFLDNFTLTMKNKTYLDVLTPCLDVLFQFKENGNVILKEIITQLLEKFNKVDVNNPFGFLIFLNRIILAFAITEDELYPIVACLCNLLKKIVELMQNVSYQNQQEKYLYFIECLSLMYITVYNIINTAYNSQIIIIDPLFFENTEFMIQKGFYIYEMLTIVWKDVNENDLKINELKINIISFIGIMVDNFNYKKFQVDIESCLKMIINNLKVIIEKKFLQIMNVAFDKDIFILSQDNTVKDNNQIDKGYYQKLIYNMIIFINKMFSIQRNKEYNFNDLRIIFNDIILPLLIITQHEIIISEDNVNYIKYAEYMNSLFQKSNQETIKQSVFALIFIITKGSRDFLEYTYNFALFLLSKGLNYKQTSLTNEFENNSNSIYIYLNNEPHKTKDVALLILIMLSHVSNSSYIDNEHLLKLKDIINNNYDKLCNTSLPIYLQYKIILLFERYFFKIYSEGTNINHYYENEIMKYLFSLYFQNESLLLSQASENLLINLLKVKQILPEVTKEVVPKLLKNLVLSNNIRFFELFLIILKSIAHSDFERNMQIFKLLNQKILLLLGDKETKSINTTSENNELTKNKNLTILNKCFEITRFMLSDNLAHFIKSKEKEIIELLNPLFEYINDNNEYEKEYFNLITQIIKHSKNIDKFFFNIFIKLSKTITRNKVIDVDLYRFIHYVFVYGKKEIDSNMIYMNNVENIIQSIHYYTSKRKNLYICNIYESWLMNCKQIPHQHVDYVLQYALDKLNYFYFNFQQQIFHKDDYYSYVSYLSLLFVSLINYKDNCFKILPRNNKEVVLFVCGKRLLDFKMVYNDKIKLIVIVISYIIVSKYKGDDIILFVDLGYRLLTKKLNKDKMIFNQELNTIKKEFNEIVKDDDDEILNLFETSISQIQYEDEISLFKRAVNYFKQTNPSIFNILLTLLDPSEKEEFINFIM